MYEKKIHFVEPLYPSLVLCGAGLVGRDVLVSKTTSDPRQITCGRCQRSYDAAERRRVGTSSRTKLPVKSDPPRFELGRRRFSGGAAVGGTN